MNKHEWIKGEYFGEEDIVKNPSLRVGEMNFVEFASGRRCSIALSREYLSLIATAEELGVENPQEFVNSLSTGTSLQAPTEKKSTSLYSDILDKIKTYESNDLTFNITIDLPKRAALEVLLDAYGDELKDELKIYIEQKVNAS